MSAPTKAVHAAVHQSLLASCSRRGGGESRLQVADAAKAAASERKSFVFLATANEQRAASKSAKGKPATHMEPRWARRRAGCVGMAHNTMPGLPESHGLVRCAFFVEQRRESMWIKADRLVPGPRIVFGSWDQAGAEACSVDRFVLGFRDDAAR